MQLESYHSCMSEHSHLTINEYLRVNCKNGAFGHTDVDEHWSYPLACSRSWVKKRSVLAVLVKTIHSSIIIVSHSLLLLLNKNVSQMNTFLTFKWLLSRFFLFSY